MTVVLAVAVAAAAAVVVGRLFARERVSQRAQDLAWRRWQESGRAQPGWDAGFAWSHSTWWASPVDPAQDADGVASQASAGAERAR